MTKSLKVVLKNLLPLLWFKPKWNLLQLAFQLSKTTNKQRPFSFMSDQVFMIALALEEKKLEMYNFCLVLSKISITSDSNLLLKKDTVNLVNFHYTFLPFVAEIWAYCCLGTQLSIWYVLKEILSFNLNKLNLLRHFR